MNVKYDEKRKKVVIEIDYEEGQGAKAELSASGKSRMVANSKGFVEVPGSPDAGLRFSGNLIFMVPKGERQPKA